jgi:hypothetical protein
MQLTFQDSEEKKKKAGGAARPSDLLRFELYSLGIVPVLVAVAESAEADAPDGMAVLERAVQVRGTREGRGRELRESSRRCPVAQPPVPAASSRRHAHPPLPLPTAPRRRRPQCICNIAFNRTVQVNLGRPPLSHGDCDVLLSLLRRMQKDVVVVEVGAGRDGSGPAVAWRRMRATRQHHRPLSPCSSLRGGALQVCIKVSRALTTLCFNHAVAQSRVSWRRGVDPAPGSISRRP